MKKLIYIVLEFLLLFAIGILIIAFYHGNLNIECWDQELKFSVIIVPLFFTILYNIANE